MVGTQGFLVCCFGSKMLEYFFSPTLFQFTQLADKYCQLKLPLGRVEVLEFIHSVNIECQLEIQ